MGAIHHSTLGAIAYHDRFGRNGIGCYLTHDQFARFIDRPRNKVTEAIGDLLAWGYLSEARSDLDHRRKVYRIIYLDADNAYPAIEKTCHPSSDRSKESLSPKKVSSVTPTDSQVSDPQEETTQQDIRYPVKRKISHETVCSAGKKTGGTSVPLESLDREFAEKLETAKNRDDPAEVEKVYGEWYARLDRFRR